MKNYKLIKLFSIFLLFMGILKAEKYPEIFSQLSRPLFEQKAIIHELSKLEVFDEESMLFESYLDKSAHLLDEGFSLDEHSDKQAVKAYLKKLRNFQSLYDKIQKSYKKKLYKSINEKDVATFYALLEQPLPFITDDARLKKRVVAFYQDNYKKEKKFLQSLSKDLELDESSYAYLDHMFELHEAKKRVEARKFLENFEPVTNLDHPVRIISIEGKDGFDLYVENHSYSDVTVKIEAKELENLKPSEALPYVNSFPPLSRNFVLRLSIIDKKSKSSFKTYYRSLKGRLIDQYDTNYKYALPFKRGTSYLLTQGFHGEYTHTGKSEFALDFKMDIGTPVHAMREGVVIATQSQYSEHGFSPEFAAKSNYIIVKHDDGTMAMYGHLKHNGVLVEVGQQIKKYQKIAYSGNTGYSSGPHLHVHVAAVKNFDKGAVSVPFHFMSKKGLVTTPRVKNMYTAP